LAAASSNAALNLQIGEEQLIAGHLLSKVRRALEKVTTSNNVSAWVLPMRSVQVLENAKPNLGGGFRSSIQARQIISKNGLDRVTRKEKSNVASALGVPDMCEHSAHRRRD